jgi:hypothetical protein
MILLAKCSRYLVFCGLSFILAFFFLINRDMAAEQTLTVDSAAEGLSASQAVFTNLRFEYVSQWKIRLNNGSDVIHRVEGTYAQKFPGALRYRELKFSRIDIGNGDVNILVDGWAGYDGNATYILDRMVRTGKPKRGYIRPGYDPNQFTIIGFDPLSNIWNQGKRSLASFVRENKGTFLTEQEKEIMEGVSTVKLVGNFADGKLAMKLWLSPEHNSLPMKRQIFNNKDGKLMSETVLSNLVQLPNGLWFPQSIRSGSPDPEWAIYQEISKISIDPIPEDFFTPDFPAGTDVSDEVLGINYEK